MKKIAKFKIESVFKITGRGLVFAGRIIEGEIATGNIIEFNVNRLIYKRKITRIESVRHSKTEFINIGLLIQYIDSEEIDYLIKLEKELKIEARIYDHKKYPEIFAISGLGADRRVFDYLTLDNKLVALDWIEPMKNEGIEDYAERFANNYQLNEKTDLIVLGVSFGGLIATEISKMYNPKMTILISSAETKSEINKFGKLIGQVGITKLLPKKMFDPPRRIAHFLFGTQKKKLLNSILDDTDLDFSKWAVRELVNWKNTTKLKNVLKIGGNKDKLLPPKDNETIIIDGGEHFMIVDKANEISDIINERLKNTTPQQYV